MLAFRLHLLAIQEASWSLCGSGNRSPYLPQPQKICALLHHSGASLPIRPATAKDLLVQARIGLLHSIAQESGHAQNMYVQVVSMETL